MSTTHRVPIVQVMTVVALLAIVPRPAAAQWYVAGYAGGNHTQPATVTIDQPSRGIHLEFTDVPFESQSLTSPQYYGYRIGRLFGSDRRWGVEFEFIHPKVFSRTGPSVRIRGEIADVQVDTTAPMNTFVERYAMSHGLNFALVNVVFRRPLGAASGRAPRLAFIARAGAGPTIPHAESTIGAESHDGYELAAVGVQGAAGLDVRLRGRLSAIVDYKLGFASPTITIPAGTGHTTALIHQFAIGIAVGLSR